MSTARTAPYGAWKSPITADLIVGGSVGLGQIALDGEDIYWTESRPSEDGRTIVVKRAAGGVISDVTPAGFSVRCKVHEYGGGAFAVAGGTVWFCNETDQRVWAQAPGAAPRPLSESGARRYADFSVDSGRSRLLAVCEDHTSAGEAENFLIAVEFAGGTTVLHRGRDFYAFPRLSPDGRKFAWICWDHPNMPWDGAELWLADIAADGGLVNEKCIAGGRDEAIFQPQWSPRGVLHFVSDRTGWWNLYRLAGEPEPLCAMEAEFGLPVWQFGLSTYGFTGDGEIVAAHAVHGVWRLGLLAREGGVLRPLDLPFADVSGIRAGGGKAAFTAAGSGDASAIVLLDTKSGGWEIVRRSAGFDIDPRFVSEPEPVSFPTADGFAHGFLYGPANADFDAPKDSLPPLIVKGHGGPTGQTTGVFNLKIQYWTSRGFAVLDVNYRGSTGFGRDYRRKLDGAWGIADVEDCIAGARWAVAAGRADGARLAISGGSAGGYTVLAALAFHDVFAAGASHYGIADLAALDDDTHKFESRYSGRLLGESPSAEQVRYDRSPINHAGGLNCPVIFFQGLDDKVVLPNQAEAMVAALRTKGIPVAYVPFAGEGHGFRRAANVKRALEGELYFYGRVFGFDPADEIEPVEIENL
jgi:dipeptidyl aminopeptidase/acylaminoacyl peptidase